MNFVIDEIYLTLLQKNSILFFHYVIFYVKCHAAIRIQFLDSFGLLHMDQSYLKIKSSLITYCS